MSAALDKTFDVLRTAGSPHALELLLAALDVPDEQVRTGAVAALADRGPTPGQLEVVRRIDSLPSAALDVLRTKTKQFEQSLRQCLRDHAEEMRRKALDMVRLTGNCFLMPQLLAMLADSEDELHVRTAETVLALARRLYDRVHQPNDALAAASLAQMRNEVLTELDLATNHLDRLIHADEVVEAALVLGDVDHFAVRKLLRQSAPECHDRVRRLLLTSRHPGVMRVVVDSLDQSHPHPAALEAIRQRTDAEFISHLLRHLPHELSETQQKNLRQIERLAWVPTDPVDLSLIPGPLQPRLATLVEASGLTRPEKIAVLEWLLRFGSSTGRAAATEDDSLLDHDVVQHVVIESLEADDPDVQAWATAQLQAWDVPAALTLLVERLDSPLESVRAAARHELRHFNLERLLANFDRLDHESGPAAGQLLLKVDPDALPKLKRELSHPMRQRRIRAIQATAALRLQRHVLESLTALSCDNEMLVRRAIAEALGTVSSPEAVLALQGLANDPSPRIREVAQRSLRQIEPTLSSPREADLVLPGV